jgi:hypothetical protein
MMPKTHPLGNPCLTFEISVLRTQSTITAVTNGDGTVAGLRFNMEYKQR